MAKVKIIAHGSIAILGSADPQLKCTGKRQRVVDVVEGAAKDVQLRLPAAAACRVYEVAPIQPRQIQLLHFLPHRGAIVRRRVWLRVHKMLKMIDSYSVRQEEQ